MSSGNSHFAVSLGQVYRVALDNEVDVGDVVPKQEVAHNPANEVDHVARLRCLSADPADQ